MQGTARVVSNRGENWYLSIQSQMAEAMRVSFLGFAYLSDFFLGTVQTHRVFSKTEVDLLNRPGVDSLIAQALMGSDTGWAPSEHKKQLDQYYKKRHMKTGIKVSQNVEACMGLALAERYLLAGDSPGALAALSAAAKDFPHLKQLRHMGDEFDQERPIDWRSIIYPRWAAPRATLECNGL